MTLGSKITSPVSYLCPERPPCDVHLFMLPHNTECGSAGRVDGVGLETGVRLSKWHCTERHARRCKQTAPWHTEKGLDSPPAFGSSTQQPALDFAGLLSRVSGKSNSILPAVSCMTLFPRPAAFPLPGCSTKTRFPVLQPHLHVSYACCCPAVLQ